MEGSSSSSRDPEKPKAEGGVGGLSVVGDGVVKGLIKRSRERESERERKRELTRSFCHS